MLNGIYRNPTTIYFGKNSIESLGQEVKGYASRVLVVHGGRSFEQLELKREITRQFIENGIECSFLGGVKANPESSVVYEGIEICRNKGINFVLAVGGGSVIDTVKAIAIGIPYDGDFFDFFEKKLLPKKITKFGVVLTIAGAGSESSDGAVIEKNGMKYTCGSPLMYPLFSILDPQFTFSVNEYLTACGNVDAISHILERYFTDEQYVEVSSGLCESLIKSIMTNSLRICHDPRNYGIRAELMWAAKLAHDNTIGFGRKHDWATHTIANEIGARTNCQHGAILAVIFPGWMKFMLDHRPKLLARFARNIFNINDDLDDYSLGYMGISSYINYLDTLKMPKKLSDIGVQSILEFNEIAENCCKTTISGTIGNLVRLNKEDIVKILHKCT